jgi:hypothetical protein
MLRSALIAITATLALTFAAAAPASARVISATRITKVDEFGNRVSATRVTGTNVFGDKVSVSRVVVDPVGRGRIVKTRVTRTDPFGDTTTVTKRRVDFGF